MIICDIFGTHEVQTVEELEVILARMYSSNSNSFWLMDSPGAYPQLSILINNHIATLNYLPREQVAGLRSVRTDAHLQIPGTSRFLISSLGDEVPVSNDAIISLSVAVEAAKEFFRTMQLPKCVTWFEL